VKVTESRFKSIQNWADLDEILGGMGDDAGRDQFQIKGCTADKTSLVCAVGVTRSWKH
jgi:hypothetical protein